MYSSVIQTVKIDGTVFRPEILVLVGQKWLEHLLPAAANVMAIDSDILTWCAVAGFAQREQRSQRTLGAIESVSQVVIRVIAAYAVKRTRNGSFISLARKAV